MIVISNTTPIISLSSIGKIGFLKEIFGVIYIPDAVYSELRAKKAYGYEEIYNFDIFKRVHIKDRIKKDLLLRDLGEGESEVIVCGLEMKADFILIDDRLAYKIAKSLDLTPIGTLAVLIEAKRRKLVDNIGPLLNEMQRKGRWYSNKVIEKVLLKVGEKRLLDEE